jgi:hypothetical protein
LGLDLFCRELVLANLAVVAFGHVSIGQLQGIVPDSKSDHTPDRADACSQSRRAKNGKSQPGIQRHSPHSAFQYGIAPILHSSPSRALRQIAQIHPMSIRISSRQL